MHVTIHKHGLSPTLAGDMEVGQVGVRSFTEKGSRNRDGSPFYPDTRYLLKIYNRIVDLERPSRVWDPGASFEVYVLPERTKITLVTEV